MRLSFTDLEDAQLDPEGFMERAAKRKENKEQQGGYGRPQARRDIALNWHDGRITESEARAQFAQKCSKVKANSSRLIDEFNTYLENHKDARTNTKQVRRPVVVQLPESIDPRFGVTIKIDRIDKNSDRTMSAVFLSDTMRDATRGFRLPITQSAVAEKYNLPLHKVDVVVYSFLDGTPHRYQFTKEQVEAAEQELQAILTRITPLVFNEPMPPNPEPSLFDF